MRKNEADHQRRMAKLSSNQKKRIAELESQLAERGAKLIKERSRRIKAEAQVADQRKVIDALVERIIKNEYPSSWKVSEDGSYSERDEWKNDIIKRAEARDGK